MVHSHLGWFPGSMFTCTAPWQASHAKRVSNLTLPHGTHLRPAPPLILPHTCPPGQYPRPPRLRYVQGLGLILRSILEQGVIRHGSFRCALVPADLSCVLCFRRVGANCLDAHRTGVEPRGSHLAGRSASATALWRHSSFNKVRGSAQIPGTCMGQIRKRHV